MRQTFQKSYLYLLNQKLQLLDQDNENLLIERVKKCLKLPVHIIYKLQLNQLKQQQLIKSTRDQLNQCIQLIYLDQNRIQMLKLIQIICDTYLITIDSISVRYQKIRGINGLIVYFQGETYVILNALEELECIDNYNSKFAKSNQDNKNVDIAGSILNFITKLILIVLLYLYGKRIQLLKIIQEMQKKKRQS
ncbi:unnamed protein product [Paramecium sonneborni]|uniref:Transmembrane protein n=1 Tax=Paramecium sonneborni TaxID=65129 RepID=A0A8S1RV27_9CILI|nr:unnamed protein product [Paramecium sonneborni]